MTPYTETQEELFDSPEDVETEGENLGSEDYVPDADGDGGESGEEVGIPGIDPDTLAPELREQYQEMVRGMNAKFREMAEERKNFATVKERADMMDKIINDPEARKAFLGAMGAMGDGSEAQPQNQGISFRSSDVDYSEILEDEAVPAINALVEDVLDRAIGPYAQQIIGSLQYLLEKDQGSEWENIASKYENANEFSDAVKDFMRKNPNASREQALYAVGGDKLKRRQAKAPKNGKPAPREKPVTLTKQRGAPASRTTPPLSKNERRQSLVDFIRQEQRRSGI